MIPLTMRLPNSVHESIKVLAHKDGISVNQFIASAAAQKMASFQTLDYLRQEAALGNRAHFDAFLNAVPNVAPLPGDGIVTAKSKWQVSLGMREILVRPCRPTPEQRTQ